ncbi:arylacetamide deacetylase-like 4 [Podarcis lilfordi]|uniref:Arylacetamide deacetylase-like 4 n=1 Tax=Podarcis lilfordi TaxID=74358 RepID=A0AA35PBD2_9SAUR|nr:arylacetamide deacetylase-like 4 [Podarcis lilfordi]
MSFGRFVASALVTVCIYPALFLVSTVTHFAQAVLPPGIDQPLKLRLFHIIFISLFPLGAIGKKLGLFSVLDLLRLVANGFPLSPDASLLIQNQQFDEVPVRVYQPKKTTTGKRKAFVFIHGGSGVFGSPEGYERLLRHIAKECGMVVVAVRYGLGPENPYPNQYVECLRALVYFMKNVADYHVDSSHIIVGGDSCGANFATRLCQLLVDRKDLPKIHAQMLLYPALQGMDFNLPSYQQNSQVPILFRQVVGHYICLYLNKNTSLANDVLEGCHVPEHIRLKYQKWVNGDLISEEFKVRGYKPQDPKICKFKPKVYEEMKQLLELTFSPLFAEDAVICQLPQTYILTCEFDVLRDDGLLYKKRLEDNGVSVKWVHLANGFHAVAVCFGYGNLSFPTADQIAESVVEFVKSL